METDRQIIMQKTHLTRKNLLMLTCLFFILTIFHPPGGIIIPVQGATTADWNHKTFWYKPWGKSGVHKGIDIFAAEGTPVIAATSGLVIYSGTVSLGGNVVAVLGPQWRIHYYAHLAEIDVSTGVFVQKGTPIGSVGTTGNAVGKPPHLHYSIITLIPHVWQYSADSHGFWRMWYLNPDENLRTKPPDSVSVTHSRSFKEVFQPLLLVC